jgi:hypothetical protein
MSVEYSISNVFAPLLTLDVTVWMLSKNIPWFLGISAINLQLITIWISQAERFTTDISHVLIHSIYKRPCMMTSVQFFLQSACTWQKTQCLSTKKTNLGKRSESWQVFMYGVCYIFLILTKIEMCHKIFLKIPNMKLHKNVWWKSPWHAEDRTWQS